MASSLGGAQSESSSGMPPFVQISGRKSPVMLMVLQEAGLEDEIVFWTRSGTWGVANYTALQWAGDQLVDFSKSDGLPSVIPAAVSMGVSGLGVTHHDIGGYTSVLNITRSEELLLRSGEAAIFSPVFRSHEGNRPETSHQIYSSNDTLTEFVRLSSLYSSLALNYTRHVIDEYVKKGVPVQRPLIMQFPNDPNVYEASYQYMLGQDLLVAPVIEPDVDEMEIYLPKNETWVYVWNSTQFEGGKRVSVNASIGYPPAFYRSGSKYALSFDTLRYI